MPQASKDSSFFIRLKQFGSTAAATASRYGLTRFNHEAGVRTEHGRTFLRFQHPPSARGAWIGFDPQQGYVQLGNVGDQALAVC